LQELLRVAEKDVAFFAALEIDGAAAEAVKEEGTLGRDISLQRKFIVL